jgi:hypothetical protein
MKLITTFLFTIVSLNISATEKSHELICLSSDAKTILSSQFPGNNRKLIGYEKYNKKSDGDYGSYANLYCDLMSGEKNIDTYECTSDYGVYYAFYELPKNVFSFETGKTFSITEKRCSTDDCEFTSTYVLNNCMLD